MSLSVSQPAELTKEQIKEWTSKNQLDWTRVTTLEDFRLWRQQELGDEWLLKRVIKVEEQDEAAKERMAAGSALHAAFENLEEATDSWTSLDWDGYHFDFNCAVELIVPEVRELKLSKHYSGICVYGQIDGISLDYPQFITDYKTTAKFDWDHMMESAQWKFYLDMTAVKEILYQVFVWKKKAERSYSIHEFHKCRQYAYPGMHEDCLALAKDYRETVLKYLEKMQMEN